MSRHRFVVNDGVSPISMGATAEYACICGKHGTRATIERHIAESLTEEPRAVTKPYISIPVGDFVDGDTEAHYLPVTPRVPAAMAFNDTDPDAPDLPPPPHGDDCPLCEIGTSVADLLQITAWSCGHWLRKNPQPIAEAFQDMLRGAYLAGVSAAESGEIFEDWYQREVLR